MRVLNLGIGVLGLGYEGRGLREFREFGLNVARLRQEASALQPSKWRLQPVIALMGHVRPSRVYRRRSC